MDIKIIPQSENITSTWSGGTTSQVYIYPESADYKSRDFSFRLSMAQAHIKDSVYTKLDGVTRYIVSLDGEADLCVEDEKPVHLTPYGTVMCFDGGKHTEAHGAIRDFNLMLKNGASGQMLMLNSLNQELSPQYSHIAFYADESCRVRICGEEYMLDKGDCLLISNIAEKSHAAFICDKMRIVRCNVRL